MRIAILGATNIKHMSLLSHYLNHIDLNINEVDIIYTDKYDIEEHIQGINNYHKYKV
ncbi:capsular biosynthesis protein, partial [Staphylococcus aureus]